MKLPGEHNPRPGTVPGDFNLEQESLIPSPGSGTHRSTFFVWTVGKRRGVKLVMGLEYPDFFCEAI